MGATEEYVGGVQQSLSRQGHANSWKQHESRHIYREQRHALAAYYKQVADDGLAFVQPTTEMILTHLRKTGGMM